MTDYVTDMTKLKSCKDGEFASFEHLLFLFVPENAILNVNKIVIKTLIMSYNCLRLFKLSVDLKRMQFECVFFSLAHTRLFGTYCV